MAMSRCRFVAARPRNLRSLLASLPPLLLLGRSCSLATAPAVPWPRSYCAPFLLPRIRIRIRKNSCVAASTLWWASSADSAGEAVPLQAVIRFPTRLNCGHQLQYGQQCRIFSLLCGAGAKDLCATTLFKSPWPIHPSSYVLSSSHERRSSGQIRCSSYSSVLRSSSPIANTSVDSDEAQIIEELWEEYFVDASQWWDNRVDKKNPGSPDFKHKVTRKALWIDGWSTPRWVKARLESVTQCRLQSPSGYGTTQGKRLSKINSGKEHTVPTTARESRQIVQGGVGIIHLQSTRIEAIAILKNLLQQGTTVDSSMYVEVLKRCLKQKDHIAAKEVHTCIIKGGMEQNTYVANHLLSVYIRCGRLQDARRVFDELAKKNIASWNIMMGGYAQQNLAKDAMKVFNHMLQEGAQPNEVTYLSILKACASPSALKWGKGVHASIRHSGLESDVRVGTALLQMYAKCGCIKEARQTFDNLTNRDVFSWNVMIGVYAGRGCGEEAYRLFLLMNREGFKPDAITYVSILNAFASAGTLEWVKEVHRHVLKAGFESDLRVGNALVHGYAKSGSIDDARVVFDKMGKRDVVTWNVMIGGSAEIGRGVEAYQLYLQMKQEGFQPNAITYMNILNACASAGALEWVKQVHNHVQEAGLESDLRVASALVHGYAKSGSIDDARLVFERMEERDVITWTAMIGGLAQHGFAHEALEVFRKMNAEGVKPDLYLFVAILSACSHAGLVDEGRRLFRAMSQDYGIKPTVVHYSCMVDLLGRAGHLEEAKLFIGNMPVEPDGATWGALLGACRSYGNVELGEVAAEELLKLEPNHAGTYVALSNIYAAAGKWDEVSLVRTMMQDRGIRKEPGRSWIEVDNKIHRFVVGDRSHPEAKEIYAELNRLTEEIKAEGYVPETRLVSENINEEDKELALCSHSEKLAIAYGLMRTARGKPIRVHKNLRVCSDCHTATKFISKVTGREIVARDANRFHHFKDGVCSCGDYW